MQWGEVVESSDIDIISSVLQGDVDKYAVLIDRYKVKIFKIVSAHIPQDYVEETANDIFFKSYKSLKTFKNDSPFINWLTVIAVRACKDFWRKQYSQKEMAVSSFSEEIEEGIQLGIEYKTPEDSLLDDEKYKMLMKAMEYLKPVERTIISMMYAEERSVAEISSITGLKESNIKVTAFRARKKLADILNKLD